MVDLEIYHNRPKLGKGLETKEFIVAKSSDQKPTSPLNEYNFSNSHLFAMIPDLQSVIARTEFYHNTPIRYVQKTRKL